MIVVTGARGSIGSALMERLPDAIPIDIEDWDIRDPIPWRLLNLKPDIIFHLAASKDAPEGEVDPVRVMETNVVGTHHVLQAWPQARVILASTCKACAPETAYGASKLMAERIVLNAGGSVARFHNVRETQGNVFEKWAALPPEASLPVTSCHRYFIGIDQALDLLQLVATLPPGRYMTDPGSPRFMPDIAEATYPGRPWHFIDRRRGDRIREPMHAPHEVLQDAGAVTTTNGIYRVVSPHD